MFTVRKRPIPLAYAGALALCLGSVLLVGGCDPAPPESDAGARLDAGGGSDSGSDLDAGPQPDTGFADPCANTVCMNGGTCIRTGGSDIGSCDCPPGTSGAECELTDGCTAMPCFAGVVCTGRAGQTPNFECGECPTGFSGDGETCTEDPAIPAVVSTTPEAGASVRLSSGGFNGEVNRFTVTFDIGIFHESPNLTAVANHLGSDFSEALTITGSSDRLTLTLRASSSFDSYPGGEYEVTLTNVEATTFNGGGVLASYAWRFTTAGCGDSTCDSSESSCTCPADCGPCAGCCEFTGGAPSSVCRPGTANNLCGRDGASCGVCVSPDTCAPNGAGCI